MPTVVDVEGLTKVYDGGARAIDGLTFQVGSGEVFGFLGPNGAGKTTTIKILTTLLRPTSGRAEILGYDIVRDAAKVRTRIGVVQQIESYERSLRVDQALDLYGLLWNVPRPERRRRIEDLLDDFGLRPHRNKRPPELSIGLRRRLQVAREFMHDFDVLFLDEPTVGLDPIARRSTLDLIRSRVRSGLTVFFTTHILEEVDYLCDRVAVLNGGRVAALGTPQDLKERFGGLRTIEASFQGADANAAIARLKESCECESATLAADGTILLTTANPAETFRAILQLSDRLGLRLSHFALREPSLEQAFVRIVANEAVT